MKFAKYDKISEEEYKIFGAASAMNNITRIGIIKILFKQMKTDQSLHHYVENYSLTTNEINDRLKKEYNIEISEQMLGQHLKKLRINDFINRIPVTTDHEGNPLKTSRYAYFFKDYAIVNLFFEVSPLRDSLKRVFNLYKQSEERKNEDNCVITVFNGEDSGNTLTLDKNELAFIGKRSADRPIDDCSLLALSRSYDTVSRISKPHLTVYNENGTWFIVDNSTNGTYYSNKKLDKGVATELPNDSFIKLSNGPGSAVLHFAYD
ncbi:MAG: hypothetical protein BZ137_00760 [Methanosphaera sp. rholeuAM130]|nr:MAG: hypothetical protein BZ137_00760 [Methanosphaera sp. rholeuAM130]